LEYNRAYNNLESEPDRRAGLALKAMGTANTRLDFEYTRSPPEYTTPSAYPTNSLCSDAQRTE